MYELVNTSAPNGLIAGTHGFSTVAMTKGMPDAVRMRVENFCAYPHRTTSHDQGYWKENPVNWFHLTLPGGDHVVGRTAPAEFDYTGRTNRLSHALYFSAKEMPLCGGAFILAAEEQRLSESWSGEPRYLKEDRETVGRLHGAAQVSSRDPSNWIRMFGPQGREYARRFAILLGDNITGAGRGIYFKASPTQDSDGTRIFGLFSDLINLLPDRLVPLATFSTFSACVPGGVTCHLRGIFDSDRAFEVSSAIQPWVDCESCEVKHAELLPDAKTAAPAPRVESPMRIVTPAACSAATVAPIGVQRVQNRQPQGRAYAIANKQKGDSFLVWAIVASVVIVLAAVALILYILQPWKGPAVVVNPNDWKDRIVEWQSVQTDQLQKLESELDRCAESAQLEELIKKINDAQKDAKKSFDKEFDESVHDEAGNVMVLYGQLTEKAKAKKSALQNKEDKVDADKRSNETSTNATKKAKNKNLEADNDVEKHKGPISDKYQKQDKQVKECRTKQPKDWPPPEVVTSVEETINSFKTTEKNELLRETNSLEYCYFDGNKLILARGHLTSSSKARGSTKTRIDFSRLQIDPPLPVAAKWVAVYIPRKEESYWQWNKAGEGYKLFEEHDRVNLKDIIFGVNDAYELFGKNNKIIYAVWWKMNGYQYCLFSTHDCLKVDRLMQDNEKNVRRAIANIDEQIKVLEQEIAWLNSKSNTAEKTWHPGMLNCISEYEALKRRPKENKKISDNGKSEVPETLKIDALSCFTNFPRWKMAKEISLSNLKTNDCNVALQQFKTEIGKGIQDRERMLEDKRDKKENKERELRNWKQKVKNSRYNIEVIAELPKDVLNKLDRNQKERYSNHGDVDYIRNPTGVNGN